MAKKFSPSGVSEILGDSIQFNVNPDLESDIKEHVKDDKGLEGLITKNSRHISKILPNCNQMPSKIWKCRACETFLSHFAPLYEYAMLNTLQLTSDVAAQMKEQYDRNCSTETVIPPGEAQEEEPKNRKKRQKISNKQNKKRKVYLY